MNAPLQPTATATRVSYEEFLELPLENPHVEWIDGEIIAMAPISDAHQHVAVFLITLLSQYAQVKKLGCVLCEPYQMKPSADLPGRAPDILFVSSERQHLLKKTHLDGPADLAVEIISPESRSRDRGEKYYEYEQGGVREYWLIDPLRKSAEFYVLGPDQRYQPVQPTDGIFASTALPGLQMRVQWLWDRPSLLSLAKELGLT